MQYRIADRTYECPVQLAAETVGGKWKLHIIWQLSQERELRFAELRRRILGDISEKVLTTALRDLERDGLITRHARPVVPPHVSYALSADGERLLPVLTAMASFGRTYAAA